MKISAAKRVNDSTRALYATEADFCQIFAHDMQRLYLLALLLTGDEEQAEACFVGGLEEAKGNPVFKEWAQSWARRAIITNAIRMLGPRPDKETAGAETDRGARGRMGLPKELAALLSLPDFERFVFVMSILEGYPRRECRLLLDCSISDVAQAQIRALRRLRAVAEHDVHRKTHDYDSLAPRMIPRLAASA